MKSQFLHDIDVLKEVQICNEYFVVLVCMEFTTKWFLISCYQIQLPSTFGSICIVSHITTGSENINYINFFKNKDCNKIIL